MLKLKNDLTFGIILSLLLHGAILIIPLSQSDALGGYFGDTLNLKLVSTATGVLGSKEDREGKPSEKLYKKIIEKEEVKVVKKDKIITAKNSKPIVKENTKKVRQATKPQTVVATKAGSNVSAEAAATSSHSRLSGLGWSNKKATYLELLVAWIDRHKRYPFAAQRSGAEGQVYVSLAIDSSGGVLHSSVVTGSGNQLLDTEAINMIKRATPLPKPPRGMELTQLRFIIPIEFSLRRSRL